MSKAMAFTLALAAGFAVAVGQDQPGMTCSEIEQFLLTARIGSGTETRKGITRPRQVILNDGRFSHEAVVQTIDERKAQFHSPTTSELNFRDFWGFNVAGYELAKRLEIGMVPPYVARKVGGQSSSISWLIPDVMMDEVDRRRRNLQPPDQESWNQEVYVLRVFNELICNTDDNQTNVLITNDWHIWMIDFTRAFRLHKTLRAPKNLVRCDRKLLENLRRLEPGDLEETLVKARPQLLTKAELDAVMARRDKIVEFFDEEVKQKGEAAVLFDLPRIGRSCGVGL